MSPKPVLLWGTASQWVVTEPSMIPVMAMPIVLKRALVRRAILGVRALVLTGMAVALGAS